MQSTLTHDIAGHPLPSTARDPLSYTTIHRYVVSSADTGATGFVDGATLLDWIHRAAHATATRWAGHRCVVASLSHFHLDRPIGFGTRVEVRASLVYTGTTSLHILVTVVAGDPADATTVQTAQCPIIFVAVDELGEPIEVPRWTPVTMLELQRQRQARIRIRTRQMVEEAIAGQSYDGRATTLCATKHVLVARTDGRRDGTVHGGRIMRWIDEAANACAASWSRMPGLTSYVSSIRFCAPVVVGDQLRVTAQLVHTGPRSVHIGVRAVSTDVITGVSRVAVEGLVVVVAPDGDGNARPVPTWTPESADDVRLDRHGRQLVQLRRSFEPYSTAVEELSAPPS